MPDRVTPPPRLAAIRAPHGSPWFEMDFDDGYKARVTNRILRGYCPCAGCQGHGGDVRYQSQGSDELREIEEVGRYGLKFVWGDTHGTGIYTYEFLRSLAERYQEHGDALAEALPVLPRKR